MKPYFFCILSLSCAISFNVFAQTITQDFLIDKDASQSLAPDSDALDQATNSAKQILQQKNTSWKHQKFPKISKPTPNTSSSADIKLQNAPFGLIWGNSISGTRNQNVKLTAIAEKDYPYSFSATNLPKNIADFAKVDISFGQSDNLWRIIAYSRQIEDDSTASKALHLYNTYSSLLNKKYGNKQEFFTPAQISVKTTDSKGKEITVQEPAPIGNPNFLNQLKSGEAVLYSTYNNQEVGAALAVNVDGSGKSYIVIDYKNLTIMNAQEQETLDAL